MRSSPTTALVAALLPIAACAAAVEGDPTARFAGLERGLFDAVNERRQAAGRGALRWSDEVAVFARGHSRAMAAGRAPFGHAGFKARVREIGAKLPLKAAAENVSRHRGRQESEVRAAAMAQWLGSAVHRKNLEGAYDTSGLGVVRADDGTFFVTQIFVRTQ